MDGRVRIQSPDTSSCQSVSVGRIIIMSVGLSNQRFPLFFWFNTQRRLIPTLLS